MNSITVNFCEKVKPIKPLHGVNCAPYSKSWNGKQPKIKECFEEIGVPYSRLHDCEGRYGGCYYIDVPNIFRNFDADETDENNYEFHYSDEYIKGIVEAGTKIVYRLGVTIEWGTKKYTCHPPKDFAKWARICEHIIMHYNKGWANGYEFGIEYWEIWNEPENPPMWTGTKEQFFELYNVSATYLKNKFPEIKVGGYGGCGFYAITTRKEDKFFQSILQYFYDFLKSVKEYGAPLDFYSWHLYSDSVEEMNAHAKFVRETLDEYGFEQTENHFNEWNVGGEGGGFHLMRNMVGASYIAAVLCELQRHGYVDKAMYYVFKTIARYNGLFDQNLLWKTCTYYSMAAFGRLARLGTEAYSSTENEGVYTLAAANGEKGGLLVSNYAGEAGSYSLQLKGLKSGAKITVSRITEEKQMQTECTHEACGEELYLAVELPEKSVVLIEWE